MTRTFEIVEKIVNDMDLSVKVNSFTATTIDVCELLSMRVGRIITNDSNEQFRVTEINGNIVTLEPVNHSNPWSGNFAYVKKPTFLQGEWMSANSEYLDMDNNTFNKTPLIWLVRGYTEDHKGAMSSIEFSVNPVIYFLEETPSSGWLNSEHDENAVNPMYRLAKRFIETVEKTLNIRDLESYSITDKPRFGVKVGNKGSSKTIIDDFLSGVEMRLPMEVYDNCINC